MADPSALLGHHQPPQQNGYQNGIDPSVLLLDPNPPSSRLAASEPLSVSMSAASSSSVASRPSQPQQRPGQPQPPPSLATGSQRFKRPFTFSEALPYSPFSSISPLETRVIPIPTLASKAASTPLAQLVSQQEFNTLNKNISGSSSPPSDRNLDDIYHLIATSKTPLFNFKPLPQTTTPSSTSASSPTTPGPAENLLPISKMVFNKADIPFRYPSPESPGDHTVIGNVDTTPKSDSIHAALTKPPPKSKPAVSTAFGESPSDVRSSAAAMHNVQSHARNSTNFVISIPAHPQLPAAKIKAPQNHSLESSLPGANGNQPLASAPSKYMLSGDQEPLARPETNTSDMAAPKSKLTIALAPAPNFNPQEYQMVADIPDDNGQEDFGDLDQRQRADAAFQEMQRLFQSVFEAEANMTQQPSAVPLITWTSDEEPTLTDAALKKVQGTVHKAITLGCFADVPVEDLLHMQRLCDGVLRQAETLDLKLNNEASGSEIDEWVAQLRYADTGLKAARLSLKIMSGGREDKQLYSENVIQASVDLFRNVMDSVIVPIAELRNSGSTEARFKQLTPWKKAISPIFTAAQRLFSGMTSLVSVIDLSELVVNSLEFSASSLIFVENAHTERDSVLGVQAFDGLRLAAMDMLSQIFIKIPAQRRGIFDDILTSLEKLPIGKQSARQFKLADGRSIQPVSALIMRLIQASTGRVTEKAKSTSQIMDEEMKNDDDDDEDTDHASPVHTATIGSEEEAAYEHELSVNELARVASALNSTAYYHAKYVINFIVQRAQTSSKSADTPYRNLLDLFVEDFTTCLETPDWPAAELLLRLLMLSMFKLTEGDKIPAPVKNMALEELGAIGAVLARLRSTVNKSANSPETTGPEELDHLLSNLSAAALAEMPPAEEFLSWTGPFRSTLEYLGDRSSQDPHLWSAISYVVADWSGRVCRLYTARLQAAAAMVVTDEDADGKSCGNRVQERQNRELGRIAYRLRVMIEDGRGLSGTRCFRAISASQAKLSYAIVTLRSSLGGSFNDVINILAMGMRSDQATVRSKSLRSITEVLEIDPTIFDNPASVIGRLIRECCADSSVQVRDSALGLVSRAITLRPNLEETMIKTIIDRFIDSGVGVRKRAIKVSRDVYLRNQSREIRSDIANGLLHRIQDPDEGVRELARQTIEEVWVTPFAETPASVAGGLDTTANRTSLTDHVGLILQTVRTGTVTPILDKVFQAILSPNAKAAATNFGVCKRIVAIMCDLIDNPDTDDPSTPSGRDALQLMMIFAKADPRLFTFEQIRLLKPHIASVKDINTADDMAVARAVVVIYQRVLPQLPSVLKPFLEEVRVSLMQSVPKVSRTLLDDTMGCLWVISVLLKDLDGLGRIVVSALQGMLKEQLLSEKDPLFEKKAIRFSRYALIVGMAGKHCDLDSGMEKFKAQFPKYGVTSVSKLMVDVLCPFSMPPWPLAIRRTALDAIGLICQSWPRNFVLKNICTAFQTAFSQHDPSLEVKIMQSLKEFLTKEEQRSETASGSAKAANGGSGESSKAARTGDGPDKKRQLTVMGGTNHDDVASATTQRFLSDITRIALGSVSEEAYLAAEILGSISRQGLVHPKETGVTMITLETSTMPKMAELAFREHRALHNKYETVLEREYIKALLTAYQFQRDVIHDVRGATVEPFTSKLHHLMDVVKDSKSKNRSRLLEKMCGQVDFEPGKLDVSKPMPNHLEFSRFVVENLAYFEYVTVGELQTTVATMERLVHTTGVSISQAIESDIFESADDRKNVTAPIVMIGSGEEHVEPSGLPLGPALRHPINVLRLRQLATGCMVLLCVWEARSYLCRQYGLKRDSNKAKGQSRDLTRAPSKVQGITGEKFWDETSTIMKGLDSQELMVARCSSLVELLTVDSEFKLEGEDMNEDPTTPTGMEDDDDQDRGRKRKAGGNTPGGRKKRQRSNSQRRKRGRPRKNAEVGDEDDGEFDAF
ncbi:sister chromatid cohesion protein [Grosmannia clavigera kw1407]|uniref:Sister chromatid cohesion protein n=1 Tax=Grosmannia clavigera (strain kw1407 / UAMH 11150) TaxID=655863 RepID=F0XI15_GROCL|nr:sister chromatid cohesion protein [Grosmannia clavigera kw1407]EFX03237.1 sister chromatid cohesion protein [Grosmannia clavigera kw1407]